MESNGNAIVFASQYQLSLLSRAHNGIIDLTFKTVSRVRYQPLTIMVKHGTIAFPPRFALMSTKQEGFHQEVLNSIKELPPHFSPNTIMTDFEGTQRNSLNQVFTTCFILGCWFHFTLAVRRKMQSLGLVNVIENKKGTHYLIKKIMHFPLLPAESILDGLSQIAEENKSMTLYPLFIHVNQFWLSQIGVEQLLLYNRPCRTTNPIETFPQQA